MDRRDFIKLTAVTGTGAALTACGNPEHELIRFVPDDDIVPGIAEWKPSVCPLCSSGCGLTVRVMDADFETVRKDKASPANGVAGVVAIKAAKKLEGQPAHPVNRGGLCPRGQAAIQVTYHPDRLTAPMKRTGARGTGAFQEITWDEAIGELVSRLDAMTDRRALAFVTRPRRSRRLELVAEFLSKFGAPAPIGFELFGDDVLRRANAMSFGAAQLPTFDLARARFVISFGADFLGTWNSPVAQMAAYGDMRQGQSGRRGTFVQVESRMSLSGANADEWVPVKPGTEGVFALGLARALIISKIASGDAASFADYAPENVEKITGVPARRLERLARQIGELRPAVAIIGGAPLAQTNGLFHALAVNTLNTVLGSVGQPGGVFFTPQVASTPADRALTRPAQTLRDLNAQVLLLDDANPVFGSPNGWHVREAIARIPFIASFGSFVDDTSVHADLILPDHSFLESWTDSLPESGSLVAVANAAGPVMRPLYQTRSTPDVLLDVAGKLKTPVAMPWKSYDEMLKASFEKLGEEAWSGVEKQGGWWQQPEARAEARSAKAGQPPALHYVPPVFDGDAATYPLHLLPYASQAFGDGSAAHLPWLQELPDPMTSAMWSSWIEINPQTADRLHIAQGDVVEITSTQGSVRAPAMISPGIAPDMVAMPVGQGHDTFTRFASRRGVNPVGILAPIAEAQTGALAWAATRVKIARVGDPDGSLILFAGEMREAPHAHETR
ncbi:MAG TPA: molybdopterin-dependent oxidoreductase [Vicinamibacterales bacterium]|jgi:anaerobic selenocysteine-containing dehydrogenase|nr:molybdopterin-dependent oxidoreductase [Vicinamibacterales bacterium]